MKKVFLFFASAMLFLAACDTSGPGTEPEEPEEFFPAPVNNNINLLRICCDDVFNEGMPVYGQGDYHMSAWSPGEVYTTLQLRQLRIDKDRHPPKNMGEQYIGGDVMYVTKSLTEDKLYTIKVTEYGASIGRLNVYDLSTEAFTTIRDSTYNISSIRIRELSDGSLLKVYYSYGNEDAGLEAGYYRLSESGPPDELLLGHSNPNGSRETINGFDLSPDGSTLLYPIHHAFVQGSAYGGPPPELATLHLETGATQTLPVEFNLQQFLWARYHPGGEKLVVSNYPRNIVDIEVRSIDLDSMYIVDLNDFSRTPLDTRTNTHFFTVDIFPDWNPDGDYLIYSSANVSRRDFGIGTYSIYTMDMREN